MKIYFELELAAAPKSSIFDPRILTSHVNISSLRSAQSMSTVGPSRSWTDPPSLDITSMIAPAGTMIGIRLPGRTSIARVRSLSLKRWPVKQADSARSRRAISLAGPWADVKGSLVKLRSFLPMGKRRSLLALPKDWRIKEILQQFSFLNCYS